MKAMVSLIFSICCLLMLGNIQIEGQEIDASNGIYDPRKFDEYTDLPFSDEKARLDNLGIQLKMDTEDSVGWYFIFAGSKSCPGEARQRGIRAKNYIVKKHGIRADRVIWVDGGFREGLTVEMWVRVRSLGKPEPTNSSTVDKNEVQIGMNCKSKPHKRQRHIKL